MVVIIVIIIIVFVVKTHLHCEYSDYNDKFCIHLWISGIINKRNETKRDWFPRY
jgi:hypothetical protein